MAAATGGTLFLDEIADLPYGSQAKLLKLLEEREYHPLGSTSAIKTDVRFMSATNQNLEQLVAEKRFREDLLYRLDIFRLEVPSLELRVDDIPELVEHFVAESCKKHKMPAMDVSRRALVACQHAKWPGHTRQLRNVVERAVINANGEKATTLLEHHLFPKDGPTDVPQPARTLQRSTREFQRRTMQDALEANDWNVSQTARQLGLARSHIYNLMREFDLRREAGKKGGDNQGGKE